jgi:hypothetical protein
MSETANDTAMGKMQEAIRLLEEGAAGLEKNGLTPKWDLKIRIRPNGGLGNASHRLEYSRMTEAMDEAGRRMEKIMDRHGQKNP